MKYQFKFLISLIVTVIVLIAVANNSQVFACCGSADCSGTPPFNCVGAVWQCNGPLSVDGKCLGTMQCVQNGSCQSANANYSCGTCRAACFCSGYQSSSPCGSNNCGGNNCYAAGDPNCGGGPGPTPKPSSVATAPVCDPSQLTMTANPNPVTQGNKITFNLSGNQGSTWVDDQWTGGTDCTSGGFWGSKQCNSTAQGTYQWIHKWKNCAANNCSITSAQCSKTLTFTVNPQPIPVYRQNIYVSPSVSNIGQPVTVTATGTEDCSLYIDGDQGPGLNCTFNGFQPCKAGGSPYYSTDGNDCWWTWSCTAQKEGTYTANFSTGTGPAPGNRLPGCYAATSYTVNNPGLTPFIVSVSQAACLAEGRPQEQISWTDSTGATQYVIQRSPDGTTWTTLTTVPESAKTSGGTFYYYDNDPSLQPNTPYYYAVTAQGGGFTETSYNSDTTNTCDNTPPITTVTDIKNIGAGIKSCYTAADWGPIFATATDSNSGINPASVQIHLNQGTAPFTEINPPSPFAATAVGPLYPNYYSANIPFSDLTIGTLYTLTATAYDKAGNRGTSPIAGPFYTSTNCSQPFFQTQNGDVHSNGGINVNGTAP